MAVDADRQNLNLLLFFFCQKAFQLAELLRAVGSPLPSVEYEDDVLFVLEITEGYSLSIKIFQSEIRSCISHLNSLKICRR